MKEIIIDGISYVPKSQNLKIKENYVIVRTFSAGVFAGILTSRQGKEVELEDSRRLWYWKGAASLSQVAMEGVANPTECKFAMKVTKEILTEAIEIINCTEKAFISIEGVPEWKM